MSIPNPKFVTIKIADHAFNFTQGSTLQDVLEQLPPRQIPTVAALVNDELQELTYPIYADSKIQWIDLTHDTGIKIYKRSLNFILLLAVTNLFPHHSLRIEHSLANGTYCELRGQSPITKDDVNILKKELEKIVEANLSISQREVSKEDAIKFYTSHNRLEKAKLLSYKPNDTVKLYTCGSATDYFFEHMAPSTGCLKYFDLKHFDKGFILMVPDKSAPLKMPPYQKPKKLASVFNEYERWGELLEVENIAQLNHIIESGNLNEMIQIAETLHERNLHKISNHICDNCKDVKVVLIAGPSSSGKTTFAQRLSIQLRVNGIKPVAISLDDYFVNREDTPKDEHGDYDFEHINALDLKLFNQHLVELISGKEVIIPKFDFKTGTRKRLGHKVKLGPNQILIVEGIHGLNEKLTSAVPKKNKLKIYVSALTQLSIDEYNPIPSSDTRLIRRMTRDLQFRGVTVQETLKRWASVRRGEERNIFPYQEDADFIFITALVYELAVLKSLIEPELQKVPATAPEYLEAKRLLRFLQYFLPAPAENVPRNSILKEFLGGSCFVTH